MSDTQSPLEGEVLLMSEEARVRHEFMLVNAARLAEMAHRALYVRGLSRDAFVVVCIEVDSRWRDFVDYLMPNQDWQQYRDQGMKPVARGIVSSSLCEILSEELPSIKNVLMEIPSAGKVKVVVLDTGGATVYEIAPKLEGKVQ
jgi:hypothetical protein